MEIQPKNPKPKQNCQKASKASKHVLYIVVNFPSLYVVLPITTSGHLPFS